MVTESNTLAIARVDLRETGAKVRRRHFNIQRVYVANKSGLSLNPFLPRFIVCLLFIVEFHYMIHVQPTLLAVSKS